MIWVSHMLIFVAGVTFGAAAIAILQINHMEDDRAGLPGDIPDPDRGLHYRCEPCRVVDIGERRAQRLR
jgi:hypothetical protein